MGYLLFSLLLSSTFILFTWDVTISRPCSTDSSSDVSSTAASLAFIFWWWSLESQETSILTWKILKQNNQEWIELNWIQWCKRTTYLHTDLKTFSTTLYIYIHRSGSFISATVKYLRSKLHTTKFLLPIGSYVSSNEGGKNSVHLHLPTQYNMNSFLSMS